MLKRYSALLIATGLVAGCSGNNSSLLSGLNPTSPAAAAAASNHDFSQKTLASKMLTAIALERVTGRKPDPSRLAELN